MPQLTFTTCLTGLLILMLFMMAAIYFEGASFKNPVDCADLLVGLSCRVGKQF